MFGTKKKIAWSPSSSVSLSPRNRKNGTKLYKNIKFYKKFIQIFMFLHRFYGFVRFSNFVKGGDGTETSQAVYVSGE